jgi:hypothetical protein
MDGPGDRGGGSVWDRTCGPTPYIVSGVDFRIIQGRKGSAFSE